MIPAIVSHELRETILDYLDTTFSFQDPKTAKALRAFLSDPKTGIFKGPFVHLRLPFRRGERNEAERLLDIRPSFAPYVHQIMAFERLTSKDGHQPQHTLVTTGTGSGKTECFLYPILDHCYRQIGRPGIKALLLYPMNALAGDQARRIARLIWEDARLKDRITAGMYVGGQGKDKAMGPKALITDREVLRSHPPDILLTNYKMLDFLMIRPEDQRLWTETGPQTLRYLVLDELHTYDGAQGSDVACLVRRLKAKLNVAAGSVCCVGTSATLAGDEGKAVTDLIDFAGTLFGETFPRTGVITENRVDIGEYLDDEDDASRFPGPCPELSPQAGDNIETYVARQSALWFGRTMTDPVEIGKALRRHAFLRAALHCLQGRIRSWDDLVERLSRWDADFGDPARADRDAVLMSFLSLTSYARREVEGHVEAFVQSQVQMWLREISRLVREVTREPVFFWRDDVPLRDPRKGLPAVYCRECGLSGWVGHKRKHDNKVVDDTKTIYKEYFDRGRHVWYFFPGAAPGGLFEQHLCPRCLSLVADETCPACKVETVLVLATQSLSAGQPPRDVQRCPACETDFALSILGSQAASLSSVAISHLYLSPFNQDKKLLAFTDSVQNASHRAAFFGARTYRFNLRTAMQTVLEQEPSGTVPLPEFTGRLLDLWGRSLNPQELVATFMPPDLSDLPEYVSFVRGKKTPKKAMDTLRQRLSWEVAMEYGFNARVGRTLDKTRCSTARLDEVRVRAALPRLEMKLRNELGELQGVTSSQVRHFVVGLLTRTRIRGGLSHPLLTRYAETSGNWYFLTKKKNRLMSPFGPASRLPRLLALATNEAVFDSAVVTGKRTNWYTDWAKRCLPLGLDTVTCNEVYRIAIPTLEEAGLLERIGQKNASAYSIPEDAIQLTRHTEQVRSEVDGHYLTVAAEDLPQWVGMPTLSYRGTGTYREDRDSGQSYYQNIYRSGQVKRIFCSEHTGLLCRRRRESVEKHFKTGASADSPNLLACTPTLELGIDVGDLSATMLCSIPPTPTNYLQRIGRSGRETGNALILSIANVRPHDLYFYAEPFEMMAGAVTPPGCFLDAPEMLKRQFLAFCMDAWCRDDPKAGSMPQNVMLLLAQNRRGLFPQTLLQFVASQGEALVERFRGMFGGLLSADTAQALKDFALTGAMTAWVNESLAKTATEVQRLQTQRDLLRERKARIEADPHKVDNVAAVKEELDQEIRLLRRLILNIQSKYYLNWFTDEGLLPNYAFPETGVKLRSLIYGIETQGEDGKTVKDSEPHEYIRGAGTAIRELAPFNTFYAESRKVVVDQVDTGGRRHSRIEDWRFCDTCSNMALVSLSDPYKTCPKCHSTGWQDVGQKRNLLRMTQVSARSDHYESRSTDETDEREQQAYLLEDFIDVQEANWGGGYVDEEACFGFEYLKEVTFREVNFGLRTALGQTFTAAGEAIPEQGFLVCRDCGVVQRPHAERDARHRGWCYYTQPDREPEWVPLFIYRELRSEALRFLLPVSIFRAAEKLATFKACLGLGLRRKFKGNPGHLIVREQAEPSLAGDGAPRRFLVLYDTVPGGTGYLKGLAQNPEAIREVLDEAFKTLKSCSCRRSEAEHKDGCYRCVYAYQQQYEMELVSRELGITMLKGILDKWGDLKKTQTLSTVDVGGSVIESELEHLFVDTLGEAIGKREGCSWSKTIHAGKECYAFNVNGRRWRMEPQVNLGLAHQVAVSSCPDFVFWPVPEDAAVRPVAVFADGFEYHVRPKAKVGGVADDLGKRMAILRSGRFYVWSLTWSDVTEFKGDPKAAGVNLLLDAGLPTGALQGVMKRAGCKLPAGLPGMSAMGGLIEYLGNPEAEQWERALGAVCLLFMKPPPYRDREEVQQTAWKLQARVTLEAGALTDVGAGNHVGRLLRQQDLTLLAHATAEKADRLEAASFEVVLRLEDSPERRESEGFSMAWRKFLNTANLVQFLPGFEWVSSEAIEHHTLARPDETFAQAVAEGTTEAPGSESPGSEAPGSGGAKAYAGTPEGLTAPSAGKPDKREPRGEIKDLLDLCVDDQARSIVQLCADKGLALPEVGYSHADDAGRVRAEAELAWPGLKVALLRADEIESKNILDGIGWKALFLPDLVGKESTLVQLLKE